MTDSSETPTSQDTPQQNSSSKGVILFLAIAIVLGSAAMFAFQQNQSKDKSGNDQMEKQTVAEDNVPEQIISSPLSPHTLVYGTWTSEGSLVKFLDLSSGRNDTLAILPINIKKVSILSPEKLFYIDQTDERDYGKQLTLYSLTDKKGTLAVKAEEGYGIDDYVLSPNKKYVATWELSIPEGASALKEGQSRVYAISLDNPSQKNLIYDESAKTPVRYPIAILDTGKVFLDKFQANDPNGGTGWAYGMSVANFDGSGKQDLPQMSDGTYGTQPYLSPDGSKLTFAGYDGSDGTKMVDGYRQAILNPNTVETLDVATLARQKIPKLSNKNTYSSVQWDKLNGNIIFSSFSLFKDEAGDYVYDQNSKVLRKITFTSNDSDAHPIIIAPLSADNILTAKMDDSESAVTNLGDVYSGSIKEFLVSSTNGIAPQDIKLEDQFMQYITLLPTNYFPARVNSLSNSNPTTTSSNKSKEVLQLKTFFIKTALGATREGQQSTPWCRELASARCAAQMRKYDPNDPRLQEPGAISDDCAEESFRLQATGKCHGSPLYLYGGQGQNVSIQINTPVFSSVPSYNGEYNATLLKDGKFEINGKEYAKIDYDYTSALSRLLPPPYGRFASRSEVASVLTGYAEKLGLNEAETKDLLTVGRESVTSPYAFVSFYDQKTSEAILPLSFNPRPDNYLNVVFYFKLLNEKPNFTPVAPTFGAPLNRTGFTAVEISEIVE